MATSSSYSSSSAGRKPMDTLRELFRYHTWATLRPAF